MFFIVYCTLDVGKKKISSGCNTLKSATEAESLPVWGRESRYWYKRLSMIIFSFWLHSLPFLPVWLGRWKMLPSQAIYHLMRLFAAAIPYQINDSFPGLILHKLDNLHKSCSNYSLCIFPSVHFPCISKHILLLNFNSPIPKQWKEKKRLTKYIDSENR